MHKFRVKIKSNLGTFKFDVIAKCWHEAAMTALSDSQITTQVAMSVVAL